MTKKLAKRNLIAFAILAILLIVLCFVNVGIPASNYRFVGFANAVQKEIDIKGGLASSYEVSFVEGETNKQETLNETVKMLNAKLTDYGYASSVVHPSGLDNIYIEIPNIKNAQSILNTVGATGSLSIRTDTTDTDTTSDDLNGDDISDVYSVLGQISYTEYHWGVNIVFNAEGKSKISNLTSNGTGKLNIYVGEDVFSAVNYSEQIKNDSIFIYGNTETEDSANVYALQLLMAKQNVDFTMVNNEIIEIAPLIGENVVSWTLIVLAILIVLFICIMIYKYGEFAYIISLSFGLFFALTLFFMQAVPIFTLAYTGFVGCAVGLALFMLSNIILFNNFKQGYAEGKKIPLAFRSAYKKSILPIVDISVFAVIFAVMVFLIGDVYAQSFAFMIGLCGTLNLFVTLLLTKLFANWYITINSTKPEKLHLKREEHINELN